MSLFTERHNQKIEGILSCYDRIVITGTIPDICYAQAMTSVLFQKNIRIFDYTKWADPLREEIRTNAEKLAHENNIEIEFISRKIFRKEDRVKKILEQRGHHPGLVHIFSAMEACSAYKPWHDKKTHKTFIKSTQGKCLHYYFYFILEDLGLCYLRVPTWAPFRLQFYYNGHNELASKLKKEGIHYTMSDNAFLKIDDFNKAQNLSNTLRPNRLHKRLDQIVKKYCPIIKHFLSRYHWSLMQVEYATDIVFKRQSTLKPIYEELIRTAIHSIKPDNIATFLGRKLNDQYQDELGNNFHTRIEGTRIKHHMGKAAIKMYDKHGIVLRIETTANNVSFFKHHRRVEHRDGTYSMKLAPVKKSIYSLTALTQLMFASNHRYIDFISLVDDPSSGIRDLNKISRPAHDGTRSYKGFNIFHGDDLNLFRIIIRGEFNISGFQNRSIKNFMPQKNAHQISVLLKRLRKHGLIKKIAKTYKYYLTTLGRKITALALKLREMYIIPSLRGRLITN